MLLRKAQNQAAYLKAGIFGFEGSGKSFSASLISIGLHKFIKSQKAVAFFDSETGSDFVKPLFDYAGIELFVAKSRSLKDLGQVIREAPEIADILIVDSLTHTYQELCSAYVRKKKDGTNFIRMQDWQPIKEMWRNQFANPYVNSKLHIIWCARAKNIFEDIQDVEASAQSGKEMFRSVQVGVGARSETESAYEPSLLVQMERVYNGSGKGSKSGKYKRAVTIVKDRFAVLDGKETFFTTPIIAKTKEVDYKKLIDVNETFNFFLPHIKRLNLGGEHVGFSQGSSDELFEESNDKNVVERRNKIKIALENIENGLVAIFPSTAQKDKSYKLAVLHELSDSRSWTEIQQKPLEDLELFVAVINNLKDLSDHGFDAKDEAELRLKIQEIRAKVLKGQLVTMAEPQPTPVDLKKTFLIEWQEQQDEIIIEKFKELSGKIPNFNFQNYLKTKNWQSKNGYESMPKMQRIEILWDLKEFTKNPKEKQSQLV